MGAGCGWLACRGVDLAALGVRPESGDSNAWGGMAAAVLEVRDVACLAGLMGAVGCDPVLVMMRWDPVMAAQVLEFMASLMMLTLSRQSPAPATRRKMTATRVAPAARGITSGRSMAPMEMPVSAMGLLKRWAMARAIARMAPQVRVVVLVKLMVCQVVWPR